MKRRDQALESLLSLTAKCWWQYRHQNPFRNDSPTCCSRNHINFAHCDWRYFLNFLLLTDSKWLSNNFANRFARRWLFVNCLHRFWDCFFYTKTVVIMTSGKWNRHAKISPKATVNTRRLPLPLLFTSTYPTTAIVRFSGCGTCSQASDWRWYAAGCCYTSTTRRWGSSVGRRTETTWHWWDSVTPTPHTLATRCTIRR